ncbi:hypothetical protein PV325_000166, partial [Microctonus aethiopoides]
RFHSTRFGSTRVQFGSRRLGSAYDSGFGGIRGSSDRPRITEGVKKTGKARDKQKKKRTAEGLGHVEDGAVADRMSDASYLPQKKWIIVASLKRV